MDIVGYCGDGYSLCLVCFNEYSEGQTESPIAKGSPMAESDCEACGKPLESVSPPPSEDDPQGEEKAWYDGLLA